MKRLLAFLLMILIFLITPTAMAESANFLVGRDIAPGTYTAEIYATNEQEMIGVATCCILRPVEGSYRYETIETDEMILKGSNPAWDHTFQTIDLTIPDLNPSCELVLIDGDRLIIACGDGWKVRLVNLTGSEIEDQYPGAIDGVNLTKAINLTLAAVENYPEQYPGLKSVEIKYSDVLPSIEMMLHMEDGEKDNYEAVVHNILYSLNIACRNQNNKIKESIPFYHGGIYDDIAVIIGVYDDSIIYTDAAFDTYYILPGTFEILEFK